jgi:ABC-2 type transport system permease protein
MNAAQRFLIRVGALAGKETIHIRRDPRTLAIALLMPVVLLLLFGFGVSFDMDNMPVAVVDLDRSELSRQVTRELYASHELVRPSGSLGRAFDPADLQSPERAGELLRIGQAVAIVTLPLNLGKHLADGVPLQLTIDGRDTTTANQVQAKTEGILRDLSRRLVHLEGMPLQVDVWTRFNPEARSPLFLVPGLAAYLMAIAAVLLTALTIATEWERGSMEQLFASPVGRLEIILGKLLPYVFIGMLQLLMVLAVGTWVFEVPIHGSLVLLLGAGLVFLIAMLGQGLLISVVTKNQLVATQAGAISSLLPSLLLSGLVFPIENMPVVLRGLSNVLPARHMVTTLRGIMLKGSTFQQLWPDLLAMAIFGFVMLVAATARFQRKLA